MKILIIGKGYIGTRCAREWGNEATVSDKKIYSIQDVLDILEEHNPDVVLNAAGVRGKPNVDWCETHRIETVEGNVKLPINIAQACHQKGIYLLHIGSGCIFYGESPDSKGWQEDEFANPIAYYSKCKYAADLSLGALPNVGIARIRVPLDDRPYPGNIIDKLAGFEKIIDVENSITVIGDMVKVFYQLLEKKGQGIFHVTNPGAIKYREIIALYEQFVKPLPEKEWISEEELVKEGLAAKLRSTNKLQSQNLEKIGIRMPEIHEAVKITMQEYARSKK